MTFGQNHFIGYTKTIGSNVVNEARLTYTRLYPFVRGTGSGDSDDHIRELFQIGGNSNFPEQTTRADLPVPERQYLYSVEALSEVRRRSGQNALVGNNARRIPEEPGHSQTSQSFMNSQPNVHCTFWRTRRDAITFHQLRQAYFFQDDFKLRETSR